MVRSIFRRQNIGNCALMQVQTQTRAQRIFLRYYYRSHSFQKRGRMGEPVVANRVYSGDHRELIADEGRTQEYFRTL